MSELATIIADFRTALATKISVGGTTATLQNATDDDSVALPAGRYFFTIDGDNSQKEHISCDLSSTALTNIKSISRQGVATTGVAREHRVGASVTITNFAHIKYMNDLLDGTTDLDADVPLAYDDDPDLTGNNKKLATVKLVEDTAIAGGADASTTVKGISKLSTAPASAVNPIAVGDNDPRMSTTDEKAALAGNDGTPSSTNAFVTEDYLTNNVSATAAADKIVKADGSGKIDDDYISDDLKDKEKLQKTFTAGEDIVAGNAVCVSNNLEQNLETEQSTDSGGAYDKAFTNTTWIYQIFTTSADAKAISKIIIKEDSTGVSGTVTLSLREVSSNKPTGSNLQGITGTVNFTGDGGERTVTFNNPILVSPSTKYAIIIIGTSGGQNVAGSSAAYTDYNGVTIDSGANWTDVSLNNPIYFKTYESQVEAGLLFKTNATTSSYKVNSFIGFAAESITSGSTGLVNINGIDDNQTGLTVGVPYYLSDTAGGIGTTAGTVSKKVGIPISTTQILIKHDN